MTVSAGQVIARFIMGEIQNKQDAIRATKRTALFVHFAALVSLGSVLVAKLYMFHVFGHPVALGVAVAALLGAALLGLVAQLPFPGGVVHRGAFPAYLEAPGWDAPRSVVESGLARAALAVLGSLSRRMRAVSLLLTGAIACHIVGVLTIAWVMA